MPHNPDTLLIQCESCHKWLHGPCLEKAAVREACEENNIPYADKETSLKKGKKRKSKGSVPFVAQLSYSGAGEATGARLTISDRRSGPKKTMSWDVPIKCLLCEAVIEEANDGKAEADPEPKAELKAELKTELDAELKDEQKAEPTSANAETTVTHLFVNGGSELPQTPADRGTEEDEDKAEEISNIGADLSSPIKPLDLATDNSLLAIADAAAKAPTNGAGAGEAASSSSAS
jgi:hypothetical protein